ncbi:MAG TPA: hypothetical protein VGN34_29925 [Ktedonobacteraceae bacterium]
MLQLPVVTRKAATWVRLPIQDELTLALAGRASRSLPLVKGSTRERTKEEKHRETR